MNTLTTLFAKKNQFSKDESSYQLTNRLLKGDFNTPFLLKPLFKLDDYTVNLRSVSLFTEEAYPDNNYVPMDLHTMYDNELSVDLVDSSYMDTKFIDLLQSVNHLNSLNFTSRSVLPVSYTHVLNMFQENPSEFISSSHLLFANKNSYDYEDVDTDLRTSTAYTLRSSAKSEINTYNAYQKVLRSRFDEGRSNTRFDDLSQSTVRYPIISEERPAFEGLLSKNTDTFFAPISYKLRLNENYSPLSPVFNGLNTYLSDLPFLLASKSDSAKHI